jgi:hypothetical protein
MDGLPCPLLCPRTHGCSDNGAGCHRWLRLVLSCENGRWRFAGGYATPNLGYLWKYRLPEYLHHKLLHRVCGLLTWNVYPMWRLLWCVYVYPWSSYHYGQWWDGSLHSSICCRVRMGFCGLASSSLGNECSHALRPWCWPCLSREWQPLSGMAGCLGPSRVEANEETGMLVR